MLRAHLYSIGLLAYGLLATAAKTPNIVFILTDDQDWEMNSLDYMPLLQKHIIDQGTLFDHHYCTVSICCPSRVNIWTGRAAHNTNVTDLFPPYGGYPKFVREGLNENWLPVWLQQLGYNTYYTGKLFNAHSVDTYNKPFVNGFNGSDFLLDPHTYDYYNAAMTHNGQEPVRYAGQYSVDVVAQKAYDFLDQAIGAQKVDEGSSGQQRPFFLSIAPIAPHADMPNGGFGNMAKYAARHAHLFSDYVIPRTANLNPDFPTGVSWVREQPQLNDSVIAYHDEFQRSRLRALQAVDEMVETLVHKLEAEDLLENTYIFYTSDNGYHIGQHRLPPGKECPFETDIHVPLAVRGPGVPRGRVAGVVSSHTDLTPTLLHLAGAARPDLDGEPLPLSEDAFAQEIASETPREHVNVEFWGQAIPEGKYGNFGGERGWARNNTYKALRIVGDGYNLLYTVWCTGEREFYDMKHDPDQINNYFTQNSSSSSQDRWPADYNLFTRPIAQVLARLDALLLVTKSCKAETCRRPWATLHPSGKVVATLKQALDPRYDAFYAAQHRVTFRSCQLGYLIDEEGPQDANAWPGDEEVKKFREQQTFDYGAGRWSEWT